MATTVVVTNIGKAMAADRIGNASTYTTVPKYVGHGTGVHTAAVTDTALTTPADSRATGVYSTVTTTATGDTGQVVGTVSCGSTEAIVEAGTFDAASNGNMNMETTFSALNVSSGDSIQYTFKEQFYP